MNFTKSVRAIFATTALLAIAPAMSQALPLNSVAPGFTLTCGRTFFQCTATIFSPIFGPGTFTTSATVFPTFQVASVVSLPTAPASVDLRLTTNPIITPAWQGTGSSSTLGAVSWAFDLTNLAANTTIVANQIGTDFPATAHIRFNIVGTIAAYPSVTFISQTPLDLVGTVNSYNPFISENFTLDPTAPTVVFVDQANPTSGPSFTLTGINLTLNG
jgi:hypothetical protein